MIRRAFWLGAGAAAGIMGYRRVSALGRQLSGRLPGTVAAGARAGSGAGAGAGAEARTRPIARTAARSAFGMARGTIRFTRDVREGMEIYSARQNHTERSILPTTSNEHNQKDGR